MRVYGVLCGKCQGAEWSGPSKNGKYVTICRFLSIEVEATYNSNDQCSEFIEDLPPTEVAP